MLTLRDKVLSSSMQAIKFLCEHVIRVDEKGYN
jgi:hypothetical protein